MTGQLAGQVVRELGASLDLRTAQTRYRGHARDLAAAAAAQGYELVVPFGGDGTINEGVNGLMTDGNADLPDRERPAIAPIPRGSGNVFARPLGGPIHPAAA